MGELREVDTLGARHLFVRLDHRKGEHIQGRALRWVGYAGDDLGKRPALVELLGYDVGGDTRLLQDRCAFQLGQRTVGICRRHGEPHHPRGIVCRPQRRQWRQR
jgi:hypothetical protein